VFYNTKMTSPIVAAVRSFPSPRGISAVFSTEGPPDPMGMGMGLRKCDTMYGTAAFVTGAFGFAAAGVAVRMLAAGVGHNTPPNFGAFLLDDVHFKYFQIGEFIFIGMERMNQC